MGLSIDCNYAKYTEGRIKQIKMKKPASNNVFMSTRRQEPTQAASMRECARWQQ